MIQHFQRFPADIDPVITGISQGVRLIAGDRSQHRTVPRGRDEYQLTGIRIYRGNNVHVAAGTADQPLPAVNAGEVNRKAVVFGGQS